MEKQNATLSTQELWDRLFQSPSPDRYLAEHSSGSSLPDFPDYITELCRSHNTKPEQVLRRGGIDSSFGHRLFSGARKPSRDTVLQLAFGFGLLPCEAQELLKVARASALHPRVRRDAVIAWCLDRRLSLEDAQEALYDSHLPLLGGEKNGTR